MTHATGSQGKPARRELIMGMLRAADGPRSIGSLAGELGVHPNTVRFHVEALRRAGRVEQVLGDAAGPGRPPILFRASSGMDPAGPTNYQLLATMLTDHLAAARDPRASATALGRRWGPHLVEPAGRRGPAKLPRGKALARLDGLLADLGFAPEPPVPGRRRRDIRLRHCPFLGLAEQYGDVICSLHLGLMQGALGSLNGPVTVDRLEPFVEPDLCVAHIAPAQERPV